MADTKLKMILALSLRKFQDGVKQAVGAVNEKGGVQRMLKGGWPVLAWGCDYGGLVGLEVVPRGA